jgi:hypothetical protein
MYMNLNCTGDSIANGVIVLKCVLLIKEVGAPEGTEVGPGVRRTVTTKLGDTLITAVIFANDNGALEINAVINEPVTMDSVTVVDTLVNASVALVNFVSSNTRIIWKSIFKTIARDITTARRRRL